MTKMILEEGGQKRAFRVNKGRLTIGSGEGATLRLTSSDVAEVHAELEVDEAGVVLKPRPGVTPPLVNGRPAQGPTPVPPGSELRIGGARITLEGAAPPATPTARPAPARAAAPARSAAPAAAGVPPRPRGAVQPSRPIRKIERGVPTWAILAIFAVVIAVGFALFRGFFAATEKIEYDPYERMRVAEQSYADAYNERALSELERVDLQKAPELAQRVADLRSKIAARNEAAELNNWNAIGTEHFETQLKKFYESRLQGDGVTRERARVFVSRCRDFRERWPQHPELGWVQRYQARFEPIAEMDQPPTYKDLAFDVETLTWAKPRDYEEAFRRVRDFMAGAEGGELDAARALEDELVTAREEYFVDRMQQAEYHWNKNEPGQSIGELVLLIVMIGDRQMADQAATEMVALPRVDEYLRYYKNNRPERWSQLLENEIVRAKVQELGIL